MQIQIKRTDEFIDWLRDLKDRRARAVIMNRIDRIGLGNLGDSKSVGRGIFELRIFYGPGYRLYYIKEGDRVIILLCGGNKTTQVKDIKKAQRMMEELKDA